MWGCECESLLTSRKISFSVPGVNGRLILFEQLRGRDAGNCESNWPLGHLEESLAPLSRRRLPRQHCTHFDILEIQIISFH